MTKIVEVKIEKGDAVDNIIPIIECDPPTVAALEEVHIKTLKALGFKVTPVEAGVVEEKPAKKEEVKEPVKQVEKEVEQVTEETAEEEIIDADMIEKLDTWKEFADFAVEYLGSDLAELGLSKDDGYILKDAKAELIRQLSA